MDEKGFFASVFDVSFQSFVAPKIIRGLYAVVLVVVTSGTVLTLAASLTGDVSPGHRLATFVFVPALWLLYVVVTRVACELVVAVFRVLEQTER